MVVLGRISVLVFILHVLALLCIGLHSSFYHFRCWLCFGWWLFYGRRLLWICGLRYRFRGVCRLVLRLVVRHLSILSYMFWEIWELFLCTIFEGSDTYFYIVSIKLFWDFLGACVRMVYVYLIKLILWLILYICVQFALRSSFMKSVSKIFLKFIFRCYRIFGKTN